ncbi:MAG: HDOD domain-containing protein [Anaerolineaceae bacterium]|nr:HDOD domain-containing protein [Anaerolineaceae bacterium]
MADKKISIEELLGKVGSLPSMPLVAQKALKIIQDSNSNMKDLANVIKLDQAMSSLILRWVNSGYYSLRHNFISIESAITYLGQRTVQNLVLSASLASFMNKPIPGYDLRKGELWKRSVGMAAGARLIIERIEPRLAEDAYYTGLFCDIGKLAFEVLLQEKNLDIEMMANKSFDQFEKDTFGYDHALVGAEIVKSWKLPDGLAKIIQYHHTPEMVKEDQKLLAYSVHAADAIMMMFGIGTGVDAMQYRLSPETGQILKWDSGSIPLIFDQLLPIIDEASNFISL